MPYFNACIRVKGYLNKDNETAEEFTSYFAELFVV